MADKEDFYVYLHIRLSDGVPFYIGKGRKHRMSVKQHRSNWWNRVVDKYGYDIILLEEGLSESESFRLEKYWIDRIGRRDLNKGTLVNLTNGGEGHTLSDNHKKKD